MLRMYLKNLLLENSEKRIKFPLSKSLKFLLALKSQVPNKSYILMHRKAFLVLENGLTFSGRGIGVEGEVCGEIVFNTAMTGYQEIISDPSYADQIVMFTSSHIGNVGINREDQESEVVRAKGIILRNLSDHYSSWRATDSLENYLVKNNIIGISEIDTRNLTTTLRTHGSLWGCISSREVCAEEILLKIQKQKGTHGSVSSVSSKSIYQLNNKNKYRVVVYDFGIKNSIVNKLREIGCDIIVVPWDTDYQSVLAFEPDGILLSNGPGDPRECEKAIETTRIFIQTGIPILGICLGHQILSLASNAKVYKMKYGHHGANHPVFDTEKRKVCISSQNHNFAVSKNSINKDLKVTHSSLFDGSIQGIRHTVKPVIGFQGHPESSPGPHDCSFIFQQFIELIDQKKNSLEEKIYA